MSKYNKSFRAIMLSLMLANLFFAFDASMAFAQTSSTPRDYKNSGVQNQIKEYLCTPTDATTDPTAARGDLFNCINKIYRFALVIASVIAVFMIVIASWIYMASDGNEESVTKAKEILFTSIASLVILFGGYIFLRFLNPDLIKFQPIQPPSVVGSRRFGFDKVTEAQLLGFFGETVDIPEPEKPGVPKAVCDYPDQATALKNMVTLKLNAWDSNGKTQEVSVTVNKTIEDRVKNIFKQIYEDKEKFAINSLSSFNFRYVGNTRVLSSHACGLAFDLNPGENYQLKDGKVLSGNLWKPCPATGCNALSIATGGSVVKAFKANGFGWGGDFQSSKDYMHFSCTQNEYGNCPFIKSQ